MVFRKTFNKFDTDGNGEIDLEEFALLGKFVFISSKSA